MSRRVCLSHVVSAIQLGRKLGSVVTATASPQPRHHALHSELHRWCKHTTPLHHADGMETGDGVGEAGKSIMAGSCVASILPEENSNYCIKEVEGATRMSIA